MEQKLASAPCGRLRAVAEVLREKLVEGDPRVRRRERQIFPIAANVLEAKRLLVHTNETITQIADTLGFDEATNLVKFFRREVGRGLGEFRAQHK